MDSAIAVNADDSNVVVDAVGAALGPSAGKSSRKKHKKKTNKSAAKSAAPHHDLVEIVQSSKGRALVAKSTIARGLVFLSEKPFAFVAKTNLCEKCGKYCYDEQKCRMCQAEDSEGPIESNLAVFESISSVANVCACDDSLLRIVVRMLIKCSQDDEFLQYVQGGVEPKVDVSNLNSFVNEDGVIESSVSAMLLLEAHSSHHPLAWTTSVQEAFTLLLPLFPASVCEIFQDRLLDYAVRFAMIVNVNSYGLILKPTRHSPFNDGVQGVGLFPIAGISINHDCRPNCTYFYDGNSGTIKYRTTKEIKIGEELCVSYVDPLMPTRLRRQQLLTTRFFNCLCYRCSQHKSNFDCIKSAKSAWFNEIDPVQKFDLLLDSIQCERCVVGAMCVPFENNHPNAICFNCKHEADNRPIEAFLSEVEDSWRVCQQSLKGSTCGTQSVLANITAIEEWLGRFDSWYSPRGIFVAPKAPISPVPSSAVAKTAAASHNVSDLLRQQRAKKAGAADSCSSDIKIPGMGIGSVRCKLSGANYLLVDPLLSLGTELIQSNRLSEGENHILERAAECLRRSLNVKKAIGELAGLEVAAIELQLAEVMEIIASRLKKTKQKAEYDTERQKLLSSAQAIRDFVFGPEQY